jgi:hypothetical protein
MKLREIIIAIIAVLMIGLANHTYNYSDKFNTILFSVLSGVFMSILYCEITKDEE